MTDLESSTALATAKNKKTKRKKKLERSICCYRTDPDGKRKRRGRKRKTALPEGEEGESTDSSGDEDGGDDVDVSAPVPIGGGGLHRLGKHRDELQDAFGASLDESQGSRPFFITKAKRAKLKEDWNDESDLDDVPHLAGPTSHFGGTHPIHHHHHFDEDEHVSAINGSSGHGHHGHHGHHSASSSSTTSSRPINVPSSGASHGGSAAGQHSNPMAVPSKSGNGAASNRPGAQQQQHHDDFAHFNIYPELLTLPSPASGSHQHSQMWFPSPRTTASAFAPHPFETGESHFVSSPIISGLAHSFGNSCGSTSYLNHTPTTQKGFHDFYPSGPSDNPSFDGFIL